MRCYPVSLYIALSSVLVFALTLRGAAPPNFSGKWQIDPSQSQAAHGAVISLVIKDDGGKIDYQRTMKEGAGKEVVFHFSCSTGGKECPFDENGHKAKVSLWYDGPALMILKTEGSKQAVTTERKLELSPDGKSLLVEFSNIAANDKPEKLVFKKQ